MDVVVRVAVYYFLVLCLYGLSTILASNAAWKRGGILQESDEMQETLKTLYHEGHWAIKFNQAMFVVAFFYWCIPVCAYQQIVKRNRRASLSDPRGTLDI